MKNVIFLFLFCLLGKGMRAQVIQDPNAELRGLTGYFNKLNIDGNIKVYISQSADIGLAVSATDKKNNTDIKTSVSDSTLHISISGSSIFSTRSKGYTVYLSLAHLQRLRASGAAEIKFASGWKQEASEIYLTGASSLSGKMSITHLTLNLEGASFAKLVGAGKSLRVTCNGASDVKAYEYAVDNCVANADGASDIQVNINEYLEADAAGASHIYYTGRVTNPALNSHGVSKIRRKN